MVTLPILVDGRAGRGPALHPEGDRCASPSGARLFLCRNRHLFSLKAVTVKSYVQSIVAKLDVHSRAEAVLAARRLRLFP
jgi:hypothetical protein